MSSEPLWLSLRVKKDQIEEVLSLIPSDLIDGISIISESEADVFLRKENQNAVNEWLSAQVIKIESESIIPIENWSAKCDNLLEPLSVGSLSILPFAAPKEISLKKSEIGVIAGLGFGTGHHASTKIALELLQRREVFDLKPRAALDVGTGSGILAIAAEKLFGASVVAVDNDPLALINAGDNIRLNRSERVHIAASTAAAIKGEFDLITANIYAEVLSELADAFYKLLSKTKPSLLILSGIEKSKRHLVDNSLSEHSAFHQSSWQHIVSMVEGNWCGILYKGELRR